ncbi:MAG: hypothetical protein Q7S12_04045 [bacterium]|nr:hypothetical protein [bacterium]
MVKIVQIPYQVTVRFGDMVELPGGDVGTVKSIDIKKNGSKAVFVNPPGQRRKKQRFCNEEINTLKFLAKEEKKAAKFEKS